MPRLGLGSSLTGGITLSEAAAFSLSLDGTDDYVDIGDYSLGTSYTQLSVEAWVQISSSGGNKQVATKWNTGGQREWMLMINTSDKPLFQPSEATGSFGGGLNATGDALSTDTWYHLVGTTDPDTGVRIYVDSVLKATTSTKCANLHDGSAAILIGAEATSGGASFFPGLIYSVAIWQAEIDGDGVTALYNSGTPIDATQDSGNYDNSSDLFGYWSLNEGTGTTAVDYGSGGNDGSLENDAAWSTSVPE